MSMLAASSHAITSRPPGVRELLKRHGLRPRKALGQHFLTRYEVAERMVTLAKVPEEATVVELGAGLGILTYALALRVRRVIAYELDEKLLTILREEKFLPPNVDLRAGDILRLDYRALSRELGGPLILFGNLPYYLSSRLLYRLYEEKEVVSFGVFMFQKEVVDRLLAPPGSKLYGILSVLTALLTRAEKLMELSPGHFYPPPEVASAVIKLEFKEKAFLPPEFFRFLKIAFSRRRKKLIRNLEALGVKRSYLEKIFKTLGLPEDIRAEALSPEGFLKLWSLIKDAQNGLKV